MLARSGRIERHNAYPFNFVSDLPEVAIYAMYKTTFGLSCGLGGQWEWV